VEDLRIAVGEACSMLVSDQAGASLELVFRIQPTRLEIDARSPTDPRSAADDGLSRQILEAVVDEFGVDADGVHLVKHRS
jgi:hypothetical protein